MTPADRGDPDEEFIRLLLARDAALAAGSPDPCVDGTLSPELQDRLDGAEACLLRLECAWPRGHKPAAAEMIREVGGGEQTRLGRFELRRPLGRGGFGTVYLAFDPLLDREVALKVPRLEAALQPELRRRFLREAQAAAALDHPHIVPVYEIGDVGSVCYIASAYCEGPNLAEWLAAQPEKRLPVRRAAALAAVLAEALAYIHDRGTVHRDLKPSNVMLAPLAAHPPTANGDALEFIPRLTDFGLARLREQSEHETRTGVAMGTPLYMAPEQAEGRWSEVGEAADVYALGVILYELLTGRTPFRGESDLDVLQQVVARLPVAPRRLRPETPPVLNAICLHCLEKEPGGRYPTAAALGADLRNFLAGQPTSVLPLTSWQHTVYWARHRPRTAALLAVTVGVFLACLFTGLWHYRQLDLLNQALHGSLDRERAAARESQRQAERSRRLAYAGSIRLADELWKKRRFEFLRDPLNQERPESGQLDLRGFEWHYLWRQSQQHPVFRGHRLGVTAVAFSPDGTLCASGSLDKDVLLWETATSRLLARWSGHTNGIHGLSFTRDGKFVVSLALAGADAPFQGPEAKLWEVATGRKLAEPNWPGERSGPCAIAPDGQTVAMTVANETPANVGLRILNMITGEHRLLKELVPTTSFVSSLCFSPDSRRLAIVSYAVPGGPGMTRILDLRTLGAGAILPEKHNQILSGLAFSADGNRLAFADQTGHVRLWNVGTGTVESFAQLHTPCDARLSFSPDGKTLAVSIGVIQGPPHDDILTLWDTASRTQRGENVKIGCGIASLTFAPDGKTIVLGGTDHLVHGLRLEPEPEFVALPGHQPKEAWAVAFNPVDGTLASAGDDGAIKRWDPATGRRLTTWQGHEPLVTSLAFSPDGAWLASGSFDRTARIWHAASGRVLATCAGHTDCIRVVAYSPNSKILATGSKDQTVKLWEAATGKELATLRELHGTVRALVFTRDGRMLAGSGEDDRVLVWDLETRQVLHSFKVAQRVYALALSPDGQVLAAGQKRGLITSWHMDTGEEAGTYLGHTDEVRSLAFSPDGRTLVSGGADRTVRLWSAVTGTELLAFPEQPQAVNGLVFSPDGHSLAAALHDGTLRIWRASPCSDHSIGPTN